MNRFLLGAATVWVAMVCSTQAEVSSALHRVEAIFTGDSTLHAFQGDAAVDIPTAWLQAEHTNDGFALSARVRMPIIQFNTHHEARDRKMFVMLDPEHFPEIEGQLDHIPIASDGTGHGALTIRLHGVSHAVDAQITEFRADTSGGLHFSLTFGLQLPDFGLTPPSVLGLIRVDPAVQVTVKVSPKESSP